MSGKVYRCCIRARIRPNECLSFCLAMHSFMYSLGSKSQNYSYCFRREVRMVTELFSLVRVRYLKQVKKIVGGWVLLLSSTHMYLYKGNFGAAQSIHKSYRCVCPGSRIDNNERRTIRTCGMDTVEHHAFMVSLQRLELEVLLFALFSSSTSYVLKCLCPIPLRSRKHSQITKLHVCHSLIWFPLPQKI